MRHIISLILLFTLNVIVFAQPGEAPKTSVEIYDDLEKLGVLGTALYVAAHPDDENTRLISYLANEQKVRTAYLSLTRGDGGQNRIGGDIREKLGLMRTNELLKARSIDGGEQFFSRANDFGFSKHPDETLTIWDKEDVLHDMVKVIREFRPDVIINRFDHRTPGKTHGHHTSSAMLGVEAFDLAADDTKYAEELPNLTPWSTKRIFFNTSWWFYGSREKFAEADKSNMFAVDAGVYYPTRGVSNTEIAAQSRSMHKSQGFGSTGTRGSQMEYVEFIKGEKPNDKENIFEGIDITWTRVQDGHIVKTELEKILKNFNFQDPSKNVPELIVLHKMISKLEDDHWKDIKIAELENIILACSGVYLGATTSTAQATAGEDLTINLELINRTQLSISANNVVINNGTDPIELGFELTENERKTLESTFTINPTTPASNPYWLQKEGTLGMYAVDNAANIGTPLSVAPYTAKFEIAIQDLTLIVNRDIVYKTNDPVKGEVIQPFYIVPEASVKFSDPVYIFPDREAKEIAITVKSYTDDFRGVLSLDYPASWIVTPKLIDINIKNKGQEQTYNFTVKGPFLSESSQFRAQVLTGNQGVLDNEVYEIKHDHIPHQVMLSKAEAKFERLSIDKKGNTIAYVQGAGDDIPASLRQIGYSVNELEVAELSAENLSSYDALIIGVRAYNTKRELKLKKDVLQAYMEAGGTVIVQYNTNRGVKGVDIAPYPMELSRDRVTDEHAGVSFIDAEHEVLNYPNKISTRDFKGWVQERGLYFPNSWDERYAAPLACSDKLEPMKQGGLLVAKVGEGHFIYTGYSWFRQLPAGVPGAFRIFSNLISIGKNGIASTDMEETTND